MVTRVFTLGTDSANKLTLMIEVALRMQKQRIGERYLYWHVVAIILQVYSYHHPLEVRLTE